MQPAFQTISNVFYMKNSLLTNNFLKNNVQIKFVFRNYDGVTPGGFVEKSKLDVTAPLIDPIVHRGMITALVGMSIQSGGKIEGVLNKGSEECLKISISG